MSVLPEFAVDPNELLRLMTSDDPDVMCAGRLLGSKMVNALFEFAHAEANAGTPGPIIVHQLAVQLGGLIGGMAPLVMGAPLGDREKILKETSDKLSDEWGRAFLEAFVRSSKRLA